ncbi:TetR/AcrR family transcriptional regulator [Timonella sp. A28]|uniref:TetR/AcrR family transcriptional regulator n=1 Tax=Timonella sp. A28 TaxID=3442640 RepID=UPI003EB887D4
MPRVGLSREKLVATAMAIADEHGLSAVTMHSLARIYNVAAPSMYKHVKNLHDLHSAIASEALILFERALRAGEPDGVIEIATAYRKFAQEHPGLYEATQKPQLFTDETSLAASHRIIALIASTLPDSLSPHDVVNQVRIVRSLLHGFVALEQTGGFGLPESVDSSFQQLCTTLNLINSLAGVTTSPTT